MKMRLGHIAARVRAVTSEARPFIALEHVNGGSGHLIRGLELRNRDPEAGVVAFEPGDVLFGQLRPYLRKSWRATFPGLCSTELIVMRPKVGIDDRWLGYIAQSDPLVSWAVATSEGARMPRTSWDELRLLVLDVPTVQQQQAIADYLDTEVAAMDRVLAMKQRLIELLQERIDSAIMGLVGASALADGNHPERALPIRRQLARHDRPPGPDAPIVTAFRDGQVTARSLRRSEGFTESWTEDARVQGVLRGDVVVHGLDGFAGAIGTSEADGVCSPVYHVCSPMIGGDADFYGRLLRLLATTGYLGNFATSTRERAVDFRNWDLFGSIPIPVVDVAEQHRIGDRIRRLARIRERIGRSEALVSERKHALITAAATGQRDIAGTGA